MKIGFIGAGKVGTSLGKYFVNSGLTLSGYFSRSRNSSQFAAGLTQSRVYDDLTLLVKDTDIIFITTGDDQLSEIVTQLDQKTKLNANHTVVHTSGALSTIVFDPIKETDCGLCSLHPIMTFSEILNAVENLRDTVFTIEGNKRGVAEIEKILTDTKNKYFTINKDHKVLYHIAACILSNYMVTLINSGFEMLTAIGIAEDQIPEAFMPLIKATLSNIENTNTISALTGPLVRGDQNTIIRHLAAIENSMPEYLELYQTMGLLTIDMIKDRRIDLKKYTELKNVLRKGK